MKIFLHLSLIIIIIGITKADENAVAPTKPGIEVCFVISARKLPDTDNMGTNSPDGYVAIEYFATTSAKPTVTNTSVLDNSHNPDWKEVYHIIYHPGRGQMLVFNVYDHNMMTKDVKIGSVSISVGEMAKNAKRRIEMDIIGSAKDSGRLVLFMKVNGTTYEDTEVRLRNKYEKVIHIGGHYKYVEE